MRTLTKGPYLIYYMMNTFLWFQWLTSMIWPLSSRSVSPDKSDWKWSWSYFQTHNRTKEKHKEHLNYLENDMGSFYRMVCFFESAVCNEEGGRLKGFQLIQFHDVLSLLLILMLVTLMNDDADDGERYHLKSRQSRGDLAGECEKAMLSTFLRQSGHCFYFNLSIFFFKCNLCIFLLN